MPMSSPKVWVGFCALLSLSACGDIAGVAHGCTGGSPYVFNVLVRDQFGAPQLLGATVIFHDDSSGTVDTAGVYGDSLRTVGGRGNRVYDIQVTKPMYADGWARDVVAVTNECGYRADPVTASITIVALSEAQSSVEIKGRPAADSDPPRR